MRVFTQSASVAGLEFLSGFLLLFVKTGIMTVPCQQFFMRTRFYHSSLIQDDDPVKFKK